MSETSTLATNPLAHLAELLGQAQKAWARHGSLLLRLGDENPADLPADWGEGLEGYRMVADCLGRVRAQAQVPKSRGWWAQFPFWVKELHRSLAGTIQALASGQDSLESQSRARARVAAWGGGPAFLASLREIRVTLEAVEAELLRVAAALCPRR